MHFYVASIPYYSAIVIINCTCSVVILAFVKSEGKSSEKKSESEPQSPNESTALLTDKNSSLEGSLRERVVSGTYINYHYHLVFHTDCPK